MPNSNITDSKALTISLTKFRELYPEGGLVSNLVRIEDGRYVVKVAIENNHVTLSTGLFASEQIEVAENRATERALNRLGLALGVYGGRPVEQKPKINQVELKTIDAEIAPPTEPVTKRPVKTSKKTITPNTDPHEPSSLAMETKETSGTKVQEIDFADFIARSDAELKRLKWTTEQGRNYLATTFGKRSRQILSDDESFQFLAYLESQPTPT